MSRRPNLKLMENTMSETSLPTTIPAVSESAAQRLAWKREIQNARDERSLIDAQIQSAERVCQFTKDEATGIRDRIIYNANEAMDRECADAEKVLTATSINLRARQADIDRTIAGFSAALDASSPDKSDGVPS